MSTPSATRSGTNTPFSKLVTADPVREKDLVSVREKIAHRTVEPGQHSKMPRPLRRSMFEQDGVNRRRLRSLISHFFLRRLEALPVVLA